MSRYVYTLLSLLLFLVLLFFSSLLSSINTLHSFSQLFLWSIYGCIFLLSIAIPIKFSYQQHFLLVCFALGTALFIGFFWNKSLFPFLSTSPYQFVLRIQNEHNHLGDLAGLTSTSLLVGSFHPIFTIPTLIFTFVIMGISFSKSAFLGIFIVSCILAIQKRGMYIFGFFSILVVTFIIIAVYTKEFSNIPFVQSGQKIMLQKLNLNPKPLLSVRDFYYPQVIRAWESAPFEQLLFGYGSGNYIYPSVKTGTATNLTPTETHNIFLSLFVENGVLSLFWFLIFCSLIVSIGLKQGNPSVYLFMYLLTNFQTDFTYAIPFFMVLFFIFAGQSIHQKTTSTFIKSSSFLIFFACFVGLTFFSGIVHLSVQKNKKSLDLQLKTAVKKQDNRALQDAIQKLERITPYQESELVKWSSIQEAFNNNDEAVRLLEKLSVYSPRWYLLYLPHQLDLQKKMKINLKSYLMRRKKDFAQFPLSREEKQQLNDICMDYAKIQCIK